MIPHRSTRGSEYIFTMYDHDSNAILQQPLKNCQGATIAKAFTMYYKTLTQHGHQVKLFVLDNDFSNDFKKAIEKRGAKYELVPPYQHRRNAAEKAIFTSKNHLLAGLATCDPNFLIIERNRLLFQSELTLNLLQISIINPKLLAWAYIHGIFDFNKIPLAPSGTEIIMHSKPSERASWAYH